MENVKWVAAEYDNPQAKTKKGRGLKLLLEDSLAVQGEFFRKVVREACEHCRIPVVGFRERELNERANATFGKAAARVRQQISTLRKTVGSPWTQDEKTAALAGLIVSETNGAILKP